MIMRIIILVFACLCVVGCSGESSPSPVTSQPEILLPTLDSNVSLSLTPNHPYVIVATEFDETHAIINIHEYSVWEPPLITFELTAQPSDAEFTTYTLGDSRGVDWGLSYIVHALNAQIEGWSYPYMWISGIAILSPDSHTLVFGLCNQSGGRGQWCYQSRVWIFDLMTGETRHLDTVILSLYRVNFSDDGLTVSAEGCLNYPNAYFGWCGDRLIVTWDVSDGQLLEQVIISPTPDS